MLRISPRRRNVPARQGPRRPVPDPVSHTHHLKFYLKPMPSFDAHNVLGPKSRPFATSSGARSRMMPRASESGSHG